MAYSSHITMDSKAQPAYSPPKSGLLSYLPRAWVPFAELARIDKPTGIYLFYMPHLFGTLYAACIVQLQGLQDQDTYYFRHFLWQNILLFLGTCFFRTSACSWNDTLDVEYDRHVARCRLRPLARGAVEPWQAHVLTVTTALLAFACLLALQSPVCQIVAIPSIFLLWFYPFAKRVTDFPQAVLGVQVAFGVLIGIGAQHGDLLSSLLQRRDVLGVDQDALDDRRLIASIAALYLANACWTLVYDTVYAQQDVEDDAKAGVRSMAVWFRGRAKSMLWSVATVQVALLILSGYCIGLGPFYFTVACGGTAASLTYMLITIDLAKPAECAWWFRNGCWLVGLSLTGGLGLESLKLVRIA